MTTLPANKHLKNLAVTLTALTLLRNDYKPKQGVEANAMTGADIFVSKEDPENNGEEFAVHSFWLDTKEEIGDILRLLKTEATAAQMPHYMAFVIGKGTTLVVSEELEKKMIYDEDALRVETLTLS